MGGKMKKIIVLILVGMAIAGSSCYATIKDLTITRTATNLITYSTQITREATASKEAGMMTVTWVFEKGNWMYEVMDTLDYLVKEVERLKAK